MNVPWFTEPHSNTTAKRKHIVGRQGKEGSGKISGKPYFTDWETEAQSNEDNCPISHS